ncbi:MAG: hypothetical protein MZW92_35770 [Comamonadaceae bacterium]|nr:hypothetical protein [Comamonadaceae bacterium]
MGLFSVKTSHPLSDEKERERVLRRLASGESLAALKEATDWLKPCPTPTGCRSPCGRR